MSILKKIRQLRPVVERNSVEHWYAKKTVRLVRIAVLVSLFMWWVAFKSDSPVVIFETLPVLLLLGCLIAPIWSIEEKIKKIKSLNLNASEYVQFHKGQLYRAYLTPILYVTIIAAILLFSFEQINLLLSKYAGTTISDWGVVSWLANHVIDPAKGFLYPANGESTIFAMILFCVPLILLYVFIVKNIRSRFINAVEKSAKQHYENNAIKLWNAYMSEARDEIVRAGMSVSNVPIDFFKQFHINVAREEITSDKSFLMELLAVVGIALLVAIMFFALANVWWPFWKAYAWLFS